MSVLQVITFLTTLLVAVCLSEERLVDQNRQMPTFGRAMRQEFLMNSQFILLDHGAYGTSPKTTLEALHEYQNRAEANPDLWIRREARFEMDKVRELLGKLVNASADDIVMIINPDSISRLHNRFAAVTQTQFQRRCDLNFRS